jgi:hypothetical protein
LNDGLAKEVVLYNPNTINVENFNDEEFLVYPNPTEHTLYFKINKNTLVKNVAMFDVLGKTVLTTTLKNNSVDVSHLSNGIYLLKLTTVTGESFTKKIIIK